MTRRSAELSAFGFRGELLIFGGEFQVCVLELWRTDLRQRLRLLCFSSVPRGQQAFDMSMDQRGLAGFRDGPLLAQLFRILDSAGHSSR